MDEQGSNILLKRSVTPQKIIEIFEKQGSTLTEKEAKEIADTLYLYGRTIIGVDLHRFIEELIEIGEFSKILDQNDGIRCKN